MFGIPSQQSLMETLHLANIIRVIGGEMVKDHVCCIAQIG